MKKYQPEASSSFSLGGGGPVSNAIGSVQFSSGRFRWTVEVVQDGGDLRELRIGIIGSNSHVPLDTCLENNSTVPFVFWQSNAKMHVNNPRGNPSSRHPKEPFRHGDRIVVDLDVDHGTVKFGKNGVLVHTISNLPTPQSNGTQANGTKPFGGWWPVVSLDAVGAQLKVVEQTQLLARAIDPPPDTRKALDGVFDLLPFPTKLSESTGETVEPPADLGNPSDWTLSFWLHLDEDQPFTTPQSKVSVVLKGKDKSSTRMPGLFLEKDFTLTVCVSTAENWNTTWRSDATLPTREWTHIAVVCIGS